MLCGEENFRRRRQLFPYTFFYPVLRAAVFFEVVVASGRSATTTSWMSTALSQGRGSVLRFFGKVRGYVRENWGAPFVLAFMALLLAAVVLLVLGLPWTAEAVGNYAYFSLVAGVVLQLVCFWRHNGGRGESEGEAGT